MGRTYEERALEIFYVETWQWANVYQLEAALADYFEAHDLDLSGFGDDENLPPPPPELYPAARLASAYAFGDVPPPVRS